MEKRMLALSALAAGAVLVGAFALYAALTMGEATYMGLEKLDHIKYYVVDDGTGQTVHYLSCK